MVCKYSVNQVLWVRDMAEQVRLKRGGLALRVPQVEFAASKVEAQGFANLARSLDSMTNYFLREAEQKAQIEGAEYGALNAPTEQQIKDAYDRGEEIEIPGDQNSVFGRAARKAALSIASDEVSALASKELANVEGIFNTILDSPSMPEEEKQRLAEQLGITDFSPQSLVTVMDTVIAGYGKTLDDTSPALARRFRAEQKHYSKWQMDKVSGCLRQTGKPKAREQLQSSSCPKL